MGDADLRRLADEAICCHREAYVARRDRPELVAGDAGAPALHLEMADGGPLLAGLFAHPDVLAVLRRLTGEAWAPSGTQASYSYYRAAGHFLGLHRDVPGCDLAVIVCLVQDGVADSGDSGVLRLYPQSVGSEPVDIRLEPGQALVLDGHAVPHEVLPLAPGHLRIVAPMCYSRANPDAGDSPS